MWNFWFLGFCWGKWTQLSPQFTVWLWVDFWSFSCTSVTSRLYSGFVFVLILMRFILQLMALFFKSRFWYFNALFCSFFKKNKHLILPHFHLDYFEAFSPLTAIKVRLVSKSQRLRVWVTSQKEKYFLFEFNHIVTALLTWVKERSPKY